MRKGWKILGGTGIASGFVVAVVLGQSSVVKGDTTADSTTPPPAPSTPPTFSSTLGGYGPPAGPYSLGPHTIPYEALDASQKAAVDFIQETVETSQPQLSREELAQGIASLREQAQAELAARSAGLVGTADDGVVP